MSKTQTIMKSLLVTIASLLMLAAAGTAQAQPFVPNAPTIGTATAGNSSATVTYTPPAFDGGSTIFTYTATSSPGGITGVTTGGPIIVTGLTNGTPYTFTVTATNTVGISAPSAPSNSVTPGSICQFIPVSGAWNVPGNWANCTAGNGVPLGVPGPADRAEVSGGRTALLPGGSTTVGDVYLGGSVLQGTGLATTTLNVVNAGGIAWGSGSYTFQDMTAVFTSTSTIPAANGPMMINDAVLTLATPSTAMAADSIVITGVGAKILNGGVFHPNTSLSMTLGGNFENSAAGFFYPLVPVTINGTFLNRGAFLVDPGVVVTLSLPGSFLQSDPSAYIGGNGTISAAGQTLTVANGFIKDNLTFNLGTLNNTGATVSPGGSGAIGTVTVNGNYTVNAPGGLDIEIAAGMPLPVFDRLNVSGTTTITGSTVNFFYIDTGFGTYVPALGNSLNFLATGTRTGTFATFTAPMSANSVSLSYLAGGVTFVVIAPTTVTVTGSTTFPATAVGGSSGTQAITITNSGAVTLTLNSITHSNPGVFPDTTGGAAPQMTHWCGFGSSAGGAPNTGLPINIAPAASCVLNLIFAPRLTGALTGTIVINSNATTSPTMISLSGTGLPPNASIAPASALFGNTPVSLGVNQTATFNNPSTSPYTITSLSISGLGFTVAASGANPCNVGAVVNGGTSCTYTVTFTATGPGSSNGTATVGFQPFGTGPSYSATQNTNGNGFIPPSTNAPASINFGNVPITLAVTQNFTFTNNSNTTAFPASYTLASFNTTGLGFSAVGSGTTPCAVSLVLAPATSCGVTVTFQIGGTGSSNGTTTIGYQAGFGANPVFNAGVTLVGNGISMPSTLTPASAAFGNVTVGTPASQAFTFTNDSNLTAFPSTYTVTSFTTSGLGFTAVGSGGTPCVVNLMLAPGTACGATVTLVPAGPGSTNGTTTIGFLAGLGTNPPYSRVFSSSGNGVLGAVPAITSPTTASGVIGSAFTYQIVATNTPTSFGASGLPAGLGIATGTGQISGTPTAAGTFGATVTATNASGTGSQALTITIAAAATPSMTVAFVPASVTVNTNASMTLTLTNPGASAASISGGSITLPAGLTATPPGSNTCGTFGSVTTGIYSFGMGSIPALGSCTIVLTVQSPTAGTYTATVTPGALNAGGANTNTSTASLAVTVTPLPTVSLAPASVNFGARTVNTTSPPTTVTLTNSGTANLVITGIAGSGDFGFTSTCPIATPPVIPAGTCAINITFTPLTAAALVGNITISSNAPGSPHTIALSGTGSGAAVPGISLAPAALGFVAQTINTTSSVQNVVVTNTGFANLTISAITVGAPFSRVPLGIVTPPDCGVSVAPSSSCQIGVNFTPTVIGAATGQISITDNATGSPHIVPLSGTGTAVAVPVIAASNVIAFGDQIINTTASLQNVISNAGTAPLNISAITITGSNAANFALSGQSGCTSIAPAASCTLLATFTPTSTGAKTAQINITSNAQNAALVNNQQLTGNGILVPRAVVNVTSTAIGFGNVIFGGATPSQAVTLTNTGGQAMSIASIVLTGDFVRSSDCGTSLASLASCTISIVFTPLGQGGRFGELILNTSATTSPDRIPLSGTGCRWFSQSQSRLFLTSCGG